MGTAVFTQRGRGMSMKETFRNLQEDAKEEHGHEQGYSGAINCTELVADKTDAYNKAKDKKAFIQQLEDEISKRDTYGICIKPPKSNANKVKSVVTPNPQKGAREWETRFMLFVDSGYSVGYGKTQAEATKKARKYAEERKCRVLVCIEKCLVKGNATVATVDYKQSKSESEGEYLFVVAAPE